MRLIGDHAVLRTSNPVPFLSIPGIKTWGDYVAVPYTVDFAALMRNRGFDAPSPILSRYNWQGRFTPFAHQLDTARFLTEYKRAFVLNGMGCIEGDAIVSINRHGNTKKLTLRNLYKRWTNPRSDSWGNEYWKCRSLMGSQYGLNRIKDVLYKGEQSTLRITLADGKTLRATPDHRIMLQSGGWKEARDLQEGDTLVTNGTKMYACPKCGELRERKQPPRHTNQTCMKCKHLNHREALRGDKNPSWTGGGSFIDPDGYVRVYAPQHHRAFGNRVYEHILIAERHFGVSVTPDLHVHHINGVKHDNRPENLIVLPKVEHHRLHESRSHLDGGSTINGGVVVVVPKYSPIVSIEDGGVTDVYDICMEAPHHNFVVNGIVVHNSGKTMSSLWAADFLMKEGVIRKCLIAAPLSCLERVWGDTIFQNFPKRRFTVLHSSRAKRLEMLKGDWDFAIINHHGLKIIEDELPEDVDLIILDELAVFRTHTTGLWKSAKRMITPEKWVWGLTGSPTPNAPTDAFAQSKLLVPERYTGSFTRFKMDTMFQLSQFKWIPRKNAEEMVTQILKPSIRYALEDCIDLPETIYQERAATLSPEQLKHYTEMKRKALIEVRGQQITAVNAAVLIGKLIQISLGCSYDGMGETVEMDFGPRLEVLKECLDEADGKVIVFVPLTGALHCLHEKLKKHYTCAIVEGSVSANQRNQIFKNFIENPDPRVLIANPGTMSHGLNLHCAATIIWAGPITSNEIYEQANARIVRPGQKKVTNIITISATPEERKCFSVLKEKGRFQEIVLSLVKSS